MSSAYGLKQTLPFNMKTNKFSTFRQLKKKIKMNYKDVKVMIDNSVMSLTLSVRFLGTYTTTRETVLETPYQQYFI